MVVVLAKSSLFVQSGRRSLHKVDVVCTKLTLFAQRGRCSYNVDVVRTKCEHYSYKVVVVRNPKLTLFCKVWSLFVQS